MKRTVAAHNMAGGRRIPAETNKNTALKKGSSNARRAAQQKNGVPASQAVTLTQSELDALIGAIGKLSMEKGQCWIYFIVCGSRQTVLANSLKLANSLSIFMTAALGHQICSLLEH